MSEFGALSINQVVDIITGRRIIKNEQGHALVMLQMDGLQYDFSDEEATELFERFDNKELTCEQMTFHINILFLLASYIARYDEDSLSRSKRLMIDFLCKDLDYCYLDEPILEEDIKKIGTFFREPVAVC